MKEESVKIKERISSIDALRGFAMFIILSTQIGGAPIFRTFSKLWGENFPNFANVRFFSYSLGNGVSLASLAQPIFVFVVGVVIPFSISNRLLKTNKSRVYRHIIIRALILYLFGLIAGGKLLELQFDKLYVYNNVLQYISISYLVCTILVLNTSTLVQCFWTVGLMLLVWMIYLFIPAPGWEGNIFSPEMNIGIYIDQVILGKHGHGFGKWTAVLNTFGHISNMLLGVLMGKIIFSSRPKLTKTRLLFVYGLGMVFAGLLWGIFLPILSSNWTGSWVLVTCGIATLLLASFYLIIDVLGYSKWAFFFIVFGVNSITIYMMAHLFDFRLIGNIFVGGVSSLFPANVQAFIQALTAMIIMWLIMYYMYRNKTFLKI